MDLIEQALERPLSKKSFSVRRNEDLARSVNHGIALQVMDGTNCAIEYLKHAGVRPDIIVRVLTRPHERRKGLEDMLPDPV